MGKCVRIRSGSKQPPPSPSTGAAAAACLTLRSGRRVPPVAAGAAACSPPGGRRHRRGGAGSACSRRCGAKAAAAKRACSRSPGRRRSAEPRPARGRAALAGSSQLGGGQPAPEEELPPPQLSPVVARDVADGHADDSSLEAPNTPLAGDAVMRRRHEHYNAGKAAAVVASQPPLPPMPSPQLEAEMEAFFAAAELAERRRFAELYNYDVALDRPLEGRYEWTPVRT